MRSARWCALFLVCAGCPGPAPHAARDGGEGTVDDDAAAPPSDLPPDDGAVVDDPDAGDAPDAGGCHSGDLRCEGNAPASCDDTGQWTAGAACEGATPVCSGGQCGRYRLTGGLVTLGASPASPRFKLVEHGIEASPRLCRGNVCVTGGIRP